MSAGDFQECLDRGKIKKFTSAKALVAKEIKSCGHDLTSAEKSFQGRNYKWATIQAYYSMFHAGRALIYTKGYRERSHYCLIVALRVLFVEQGVLDVRLVEAFQTAKSLRENADYEDEFSKEGAEGLLDKAKEWLRQAKLIAQK